ncbi:hypothetical protein [Colwellia psychrerythraea]|uniref:Putative lipoprotein n=1 Tax=Colwellia psychrerythraea (strain 34H / ATCC BAA-681) TaxID=167879 RepID=Q486W1_COLP3|nr:hypothetical protein [Colwellia psychrerythraea]AAZ27510.1 putative lipoprotein [Colwellia psychrerythraea 34H]
MHKHLISPLLLTLLLQGCGGGSSSSPEVPVDPVEYTFSLTAQLTNDCGVASAFSDVELLLQDDTWQTLNTYKADDSGVISFVTTSEFINYTLVAKDQQGSEAQGLNVVSFYQASSATPSHYQAQFDELVDNTSCECVTQNLELSHRPFVTQLEVTSSLPFDNWKEVDDSTTLFEDVKVCRAVEGEWPLHSFSVKGTDANQKAIAAADFSDDFTENVAGVWTLSAFQVADAVDLVMPHQDFNTNQLIEGTTHFPIAVTKDDDSVLVFSTHDHISKTFYQSQASVTFDESSSIFGSSVIKTHHQLISTIAKDSFLVNANEQKPPIDDRNFSEIKEDGSYDYSAVSGYPVAVISFTFTTFDPTTKLLMPAKWTFYGPEQGMLAISADLTGYTDIINIDTDKKSTDIHLMKSMMTNNYQDYIKYYQAGNTVENALDANNDFVKNLNEVEISIKLK